jgi:hypothetical protein
VGKKTLEGRNPGGYRGRRRSKPPLSTNGLLKGSKAVKTASGSRKLLSGGKRDGRFGESQLAGRNRRDGGELASVGTLSLWMLRFAGTFGGQRNVKTETAVVTRCGSLRRGKP